MGSTPAARTIYRIVGDSAALHGVGQLGDESQEPAVESLLEDCVLRNCPGVHLLTGIPHEPKETVPVTEILCEVANECFQLIEGR